MSEIDKLSKPLIFLAEEMLTKYIFEIFEIFEIFKLYLCHCGMDVSDIETKK